MVVPHDSPIPVIDGGGLRPLRNRGTDVSRRFDLLKNRRCKCTHPRKFAGGLPGHKEEANGET